MYSTKEILPGEGLEAVPDRVAPEALHPQQFQWDQSAKPQWQVAVPTEDGVLRDDAATSTPAASSTIPPTTSGTTSSTTSTASIVEATSRAIAVSGCPSRNDSSMTEGKLTYKILCDFDLSGTSSVNTVLSSFEQCLQLCDSLNTHQGRDDIGCIFNESGVNDQTPGSCWCKGGVGVRVIPNPGIMVGTPI